MPFNQRWRAGLSRLPHHLSTALSDQLDWGSGGSGTG